MTDCVDRGARLSPVGKIAIATLVLALLPACGKKVEADCQLVGPNLLGQIQAATGSDIQVAYAVPSRTNEGHWLVAASTGHGVAVWGTRLPPGGRGMAYVLNLNQAAIDDSVAGVEVPEGMQPAEAATKDAAGIAAAEGCVTDAGTT